MSKDILWLSDFDRYDFPGGSQYSTWHIIEYGKKLGYDIELITRRNISRWIADKGYNKKYDLVITGTFILLQNIPNLLDWLNSQTHIRRESDITLYLDPHTRLKLFQSTQKSIFLCQEHYQYFIEKYFKENNNINYEIVFPYVGPEFKDYHNKRTEAILWAGHLNKNKGIEKFIDLIYSHPEKQFVVAYNTCDNQSFESFFEDQDNVSLIKRTSREQMPELYNKYTDFFLMPLQQEGFCLSVSEALLSGMNVMTNDLVPAKKNYVRLGLEKFRSECLNGPKKFWERCE